MSRWVIAIALTWSTWAVQQPAVAHARPLLSSELGPAMCEEGALTVFFEELALGRPLSHEVVREQDDGPDDRDHDHDQGMLRASPTHDDGPPAWCISPDDPRCSPRDQSAPLPGPRAHVPVQDAAAMRPPELAAVSGVVSLRPHQLGAPRAGVALLLERPPRS